MVLTKATSQWLGGEGVVVVARFGNGRFCFPFWGLGSDSCLAGSYSRLAVNGIARPWGVGDGVMVAYRLEGDLGGFLSGCADLVWISARQGLVVRYAAALSVDDGVTRWCLFSPLASG